MSDDLDEIDAALRRAMAALDGEAPAGYFDALPERTLARLDDPALGELPDEPGRKRRREPSEPPARPLRAVQGLPPDDDDDDDDAVFSSQIMAAVELPEADELAEPAPPGALPRRDRASASSAIMRAVEDAAVGGERGEMRMDPASASSVGMRAVAVDVEVGELGDPRETGVAGSELGARPASSRITRLPAPPVEPARPEAAAGARSAGAAASMTEAGRGRRGRRVRAAILGIGGIGLAAVAVMYLRAGDRTPRSASSSTPSSASSSVSNRGPASPSTGSGPSASSPAAGSAASAAPVAGGDTVVSAKPTGVASGPGSGSAATTAAAAGSGVVPGLASDPVSEPGGKPGELVKRPGKARPPAKGGGKPEVPLSPGAVGKGAAKQAGADAPASEESGVPGKKLKSPKPRPDRASLSSDDIERAMTAVAGQARACVAGTGATASLRLTVTPSGRIAQVAVTGPLAGTPAGTCLERAVQAATFPHREGVAQSFEYSYQSE